MHQSVVNLRNEITAYKEKKEKKTNDFIRLSGDYK